MTAPAEQLLHKDERPLALLARNLSTRWLAIAAETFVGVVMLPFNVAHLGPAAYGLWVLTGSVTVHFSILNLGYAGALVKYVAQYRAHRNVQALNEIASTLFFVFAAVGVVAYGIAVGLAFNIDSIFELAPGQAETGKLLLLMIGLQVALNFPFSVYGGIVGGFQRYHVNSGIAIVAALTTALVNVAVLLAGYGLVTLVAATTTVRLVSYFVYRWSALRIFPGLRISWSLFRKERLREVTGFSVYAFIIDWANKLNYESDTLVIGALLGTAPVAVWTAASRIIVGTQTLSNQLNGLLFPLVVDSDALQQRQRLQQILLHGTQMSLLMVLSMAMPLIALGDPLIRAWVGVEMLGSVPVLYILAVAVAIRVGNGTSSIVLKGAGGHRFLAWTNLSAGIGNVLVSIVLVTLFGIVGAAIGTLMAVLTAATIVCPTACRRVGIPVTTLLRRSVLPAVWPALVAGAVLAATRSFSSGGSLLLVLVHAAAGALLYAAIFFLVAIDRDERARQLARVRELLVPLIAAKRQTAAQHVP